MGAGGEQKQGGFRDCVQIELELNSDLSCPHKSSPSSFAPTLNTPAILTQVLERKHLPLGDSEKRLSGRNWPMLWSTVALAKTGDFDSHRRDSINKGWGVLKAKNVVSGVRQNLLQFQICPLVPVTSHL